MFCVQSIEESVAPMYDPADLASKTFRQVGRELGFR